MGVGIALILVGLLTLILTIIKPNFYWNSRKAVRARRIFGDTVASIIYLVLGVIIIVIGVGQFL